jgi:hypothetical protein
MTPLVQRPGCPDINGESRHHQQDIERLPVLPDKLRYQFDRFLLGSSRISKKYRDSARGRLVSQINRMNKVIVAHEHSSFHPSPEESIPSSGGSGQTSVSFHPPRLQAVGLPVPSRPRAE